MSFLYSLMMKFTTISGKKIFNMLYNYDRWWKAASKAYAISNFGFTSVHGFALLNSKQNNNVKYICIAELGKKWFLHTNSTHK